MFRFSRTALAAFAVFALSAISATAQDVPNPYLGVWQGTMSYSNIHHRYSANVTVCLGAKFKGARTGQDIFGWLSAKSNSFGVRTKHGATPISEMTISGNTLTFKAHNPKGTNIGIVTLAGDKLVGKTQFITDTATAFAQAEEGPMDLTRVKAFAPGEQCPPAAEN